MKNHNERSESDETAVASESSTFSADDGQRLGDLQHIRQRLEEFGALLSRVELEHRVLVLEVKEALGSQSLRTEFGRITQAGERLLYQLLAAGKSQADIARELGVSRAAVSLRINGRKARAGDGGLGQAVARKSDD